jgi:hypothetical protein
MICTDDILCWATALSGVEELTLSQRLVSR